MLRPGAGRLEGKVAIVTGAGSVGPGWGNGRATAVRFAEEGARVLAVDLHRDSLEATLDAADGAAGEVRAHVADATEPEAVAAVVARCLREFGTLDVLVNNVGGSRPGGPVELSLEDWDAQLRFNLTSAFLLCKHALPVLTAKGAGAVVNTSSTSGIRWTGAAQVAYAAAKAGILGMTRSIAVQHAPDGVRANVVVPGQLHTPMVEARLAGQRTGGDVRQIVDQRLARIPLGFAGDGRDTANAALFLASDEARFVTGTEIVVDGGMSARCD